MRKKYLIVAPTYTPLSAGIKALYLLRNFLVASGEDASISPMGVLQPKVSDDVIVVYPEIIEGNPLQAKHVVRWLLYYAGRYRGNFRFPDTDMVWGYTTRIAIHYGTFNVMFLPTVDENIFIPAPGVERFGSCFYAHKFQNFYHGKVSLTDSEEIKNPGQSQEEIVRILQSRQIMYAYEDTALIIESVLCGCPVVCIPNKFWPECCGLGDFRSGIAWGFEELDKAKETVGEARENYKILKENFLSQLESFIKKTQSSSQ